MSIAEDTRRAAGEQRDAEEIEAALAELRRLFEAGEVEEARRLAPEFAARWPENRRVQRWARVLEPPRAWVSSSCPTHDLSQEHEWLKQHRHEYPGCWIAVHKDRLILADADLGRVHEAIRELPEGERAVIYYEGKSPE